LVGNVSEIVVWTINVGATANIEDGKDT
jgi:hypothetical protein